MAAVLARRHLSEIAGKQQQLLLQYALRRSPARRLPGTGVVPLPLCSAPFLGSNCSSRRLKYNAVAGVALGGDKAAADHHHAVGALDDDLGKEEHYSGAGTSPPSSSSREYHSVAVPQAEAAADGDGGGGGEKVATRLARGVSKGAVLLGWGEPETGGGPHYN